MLELSSVVLSTNEQLTTSLLQFSWWNLQFDTEAQLKEDWNN